MRSRNTVTSKALKLIPYYKTFRSTHALLQRSQWWSREQLEEYQLQQLDKLLNHAYENVPYYTNIFDERGLRPSDIQDFNDLQQIPFLTKELVRDNLGDLKATNYPPDKFEYVTTGGTTGVPLGFYYERDVSRAKEWAFIKTLWERLGYKFCDKCVVLRGRVIDKADKGIYWDTTLFGIWLFLSSYHMADENLPRYIDIINKFKPKFIQAYPSTITILAKFMKKNNIPPFPTVKALLLASENLYTWQRELLEGTFQCRIFSWYGHSEMGVLAGECEHSPYYHIFPQYGVVELIDTDGNSVTDNGKTGEIVTTGFNNLIVPLIRYKTGDFGAYSDYKCSCRREFRLFEKVEGRWTQELIVARNRRYIPITALNMHSDVFDNVDQFQFYQEKEGKLILNIVKKGTYSKRDSEYILHELLKKLGHDVELELCFVDHISRTQTGKFKFLVQKLPVDIRNL